MGCRCCHFVLEVAYVQVRVYDGRCNLVAGRVLVVIVVGTAVVIVVVIAVVLGVVLVGGDVAMGFGVGSGVVYGVVVVVFVAAVARHSEHWAMGVPLSLGRRVLCHLLLPFWMLTY